MKKKSPSIILGWLLAAAVVIAFFLPWARHAPLRAPGNAMELARDLIVQEDDPVRSYVLMRSSEWRALWAAPGEGVSAYQLMVLPSAERERNHAASGFLSMIWGSHGGDFKLKLVILAPVLALVGAFLMLMKKPPVGMLFAAAGGQLFFYLFFRVRMNQSTADRVLQQIDYNLGLWLTLYGLALLAVVMVLKAVLPPKWKW